MFTMTMAAMATMAGSMHPDKEDENQQPKPVFCKPFHEIFSSILVAVIKVKCCARKRAVIISLKKTIYEGKSDITGKF